MADVHTAEQRSRNMSAIRAKNTKPELIIRRGLYARGIRGYRIHHNIAGKPDLVFTRQKIAIFIDGCYWHKCPICFHEPQTNRNFWMKKINGNVERDLQVNEELKKNGWLVLRFWEHEVRKEQESVVDRIAEAIKKRN
ncbi:very short patch repair endonuclease [Methanolacinia paynteri]|uniref:very short patch repair endonuclease n=1 Tax=Methanolacinia paynteri TaxID=230356 RepID=UPI00064FD82F|nr:very short patch repair endonuclease [Methanolacinia paynteri]